MRTRFLSFSILALLLLFSAKEVFAFGLGFMGNFHGGTAVWEGSPRDHIAGGGGFVLDTNLARDEVFNYRMELTFGKLDITQKVTSTRLLPLFGTIVPIQVTSTAKSGTLLMTNVHYFGFGVVRTKYVRFWLGPQLTIAGMLTDVKGLLGGFGLALGINFNIGEIFTISLVGAGRFVGGFTNTTYEGTVYTYGGYGGDGMGAISFIFRINDSYTAAR